MWTGKQQILQGFASLCQQIENALVVPAPEIEQEVLRSLIDHLVIEPDAIQIKHIIPTDDDC